MDCKWNPENQGNQKWLLPPPVLAEQGQEWLEQELKAGDRDPPKEQKGEEGREAEADYSLVEEEWGVGRPTTHGPGGTRPQKLRLHPN